MSEVKRYEAYLISADTDKVYVRESDYRELEERCAGLERELAARDKTIANFDFDIVPKLDARIRTLEAALRKIVTMDPCVDWCHFDGDEEEGTDILSIARAALAPTATEGDK